MDSFPGRFITSSHPPEQPPSPPRRAAVRVPLVEMVPPRIRSDPWNPELVELGSWFVNEIRDQLNSPVEVGSGNPIVYRVLALSKKVVGLRISATEAADCSHL